MRRARAVMAAVLAAAVLLAVPTARAVTPDEMLADPALETRARELSKGLRCVVCRNQSIDDSNAGIAADMRVVLRERLAAGDSDEAALAYMVERYGAYILLKPPLVPATYALWVGPFALLLIGLLVASRLWRRGDGSETPTALSARDRDLVERLLREDGDK